VNNRNPWSNRSPEPTEELEWWKTWRAGLAAVMPRIPFAVFAPGSGSALATVLIESMRLGALIATTVHSFTPETYTGPLSVSDDISARCKAELDGRTLFVHKVRGCGGCHFADLRSFTCEHPQHLETGEDAPTLESDSLRPPPHWCPLRLASTVTHLDLS
jgi:hypothetical protein